MVGAPTNYYQSWGVPEGGLLFSSFSSLCAQVVFHPYPHVACGYTNPLIHYILATPLGSSRQPFPPPSDGSLLPFFLSLLPCLLDYGIFFLSYFQLRSIVLHLAMTLNVILIYCTPQCVYIISQDMLYLHLVVIQLLVYWKNFHKRKQIDCIVQFS